MAGDNPDVIIGTFGDPSVFYGPSAGRGMLAAEHKESEPDLVSDAPLAGPQLGSVAGQSLNTRSFRAFTQTPFGVTLLALPLAYLAFHHVFGAAS